LILFKLFSRDNKIFRLNIQMTACVMRCLIQKISLLRLDVQMTARTK